MSKDDASASTSSNHPSSYSKRHSRITKENLFMILALWMEDFPLEDNENPGNSGDPKPLCKKVGAVLVSPNDIVYAVDCTRDGVHGIARLLIKHHGLPEGCKVFVSRKPCSFCTKLLVQSGKVKRVFYLPFKPEYLTESESADFKAETVRVDSLFKASAIGQSVFVPIVEKAVLDDAQNRRNRSNEMGSEIESRRTALFSKYSAEYKWMCEEARVDLPWPAFDDSMGKQVLNDFENTMKWVAQILVLPEEANTFVKFDSDTVALADNSTQRKQAVRLLEMAQFLAERSDDPKTGVGAIITDDKMGVKALGWNGFPLKALYGEFPRASDDDQGEADKKYPYVIHAEQNALLMRNDKNLEGGMLFVTKTPCNECVPLLEMQEIKRVFLDADSTTKPQNSEQQNAPDTKVLSYKKFADKIEKGVFSGYKRQTTY